MIIFFLLGQACVFHLQVLNMSLSSFILVLAMVCLIILSLFFFFHAAVVVAVLLRDQLWLHWYS